MPVFFVSKYSKTKANQANDFCGANALVIF